MNVFVQEISQTDGNFAPDNTAQAPDIPVLLLALDGEGGNFWQWIDVGVRDGPTTAIRHEGRLFELDFELESSELIAATLVESGDFSGVRLADVEPVTNTEQQDQLPCMPQGAYSFQFKWIESGRCSLEDVRNARVVIQQW